MKVFTAYKDTPACTRARVHVRSYLDYLDYDFEAGSWDIWYAGDVQEERIRALSPTSDDKKPYNGDWTVAQHEQRVRNLMEVANLPPISLDIMGDGTPRIEDGCHRLMAAYLRGDETIEAKIGGYIDYLPDMVIS